MSVKTRQNQILVATVKKSISLILSGLIPYHVRRTPVQFVLKIFFRWGEMDIFARESKYANLIAKNYASLSISRNSKRLYLIFLIYYLQV